MSVFVSSRRYGGGSFSFSNLIAGVTKRFSTEFELQQVRQLSEINFFGHIWMKAQFSILAFLSWIQIPLLSAHSLMWQCCSSSLF